MNERSGPDYIGRIVIVELVETGRRKGVILLFTGWNKKKGGCSSSIMVGIDFFMH